MTAAGQHNLCLASSKAAKATLHVLNIFISAYAAEEPLPEAEEDLQEQHAQQQRYAQQDHQQQHAQQAQPPPQQQPAAGGKPGKKGPSALGLQLAVGSQMETGEWRSNGVWVKKDKQAQAVPSNLQVIPAEDLVKVRVLHRPMELIRSRGRLCCMHRQHLQEAAESGGGMSDP